MQVVTIHYTRVTDDDDRQHIMTIAGHCNEIAMFGKNFPERIIPIDI